MPTRHLWFWGPKNHDEDLASASFQTYHKVSGGAYIVRMDLSQLQNPKNKTVANILRTEPLPATKQKKKKKGWGTTELTRTGA